MKAVSVYELSDQESLRDEYDDAAKSGDLEQARAEPCHDRADDESQEARSRRLGRVNDVREGHHRQRDIRYVE